MGSTKKKTDEMEIRFRIAATGSDADIYNRLVTIDSRQRSQVAKAILIELYGARNRSR